MSGNVAIDKNMKNSANNKVLKKIVQNPELLTKSLRLAKKYYRDLKNFLCVPHVGWPCMYIEVCRATLFLTNEATQTQRRQAPAFRTADDRCKLQG